MFLVGYPLAVLSELDLLLGDERLLESSSDCNSLDSRVKTERRRGVVQSRGSELVGLSDESLTEAAVVVGRNLTADTGRLVQVDKVQLGLGVDSDLAVGTEDLGGVLLTSSHHARAVQLSDLATVELDDTESVVTVVVLAQIRLHGGDTNSCDALDLDVLAEEPKSQVNIVDGAVDEDTTGEFGVGNEETTWVELVTSLGAED